MNRCALSCCIMTILKRIHRLSSGTDGLAEAVGQARDFIRKGTMKLMAQCDKSHKCRNSQLWEMDGKLGLNLRKWKIPPGSPERSIVPGAVKAESVQSLLRGKMKIKDLEDCIKDLKERERESNERHSDLITQVGNLEESNSRLSDKIRIGSC